MSVYTKTGDQGKTALIGGKRVFKNHPRIEAYGTVDELMAHTALLMDVLEDGDDKAFLLWTLDRLMVVSSVLAAEADAVKKLPALTSGDVLRVERAIDGMESRLEPSRSFILPGGHPSVSQCHVARTVCRRAERAIVALGQEYEAPLAVYEYMNRMSDYFFVLSRKITKDMHVTPKKWIPVVDE
ncbi:MAG: cob(I)yrinic acid a,c-diamide adenosyltransferase [Bacteroidales bacterium]|jgi:cob(I)alamin adenosyltransferase|nr:cob(I)yrinic acid a,c-diamide adenosyltransferase [Bacteroidales bacterium]